MDTSGTEGRRATSQEGQLPLAALLHNAAAVTALAATVEGTLGPRGLNCMLVDQQGEITITNDGATILSQMEVHHPAARLLIQTARAQDEHIGDGTTTATILAAALIQEGVKQIQRGVPAIRVVEGIKRGINAAIEAMQHAARPVTLADPLLRQAALIAGRGEQELADLVIKGAQKIPADKLLRDQAFQLREQLVAIAGAENEVLPGVLVEKSRVSTQMPAVVAPARLLLMEDALEPEALESEALATEAGFQHYLAQQRDFLDQLHKLAELGVNCVFVQRNIAAIAEEFLIEQNIFAVRRVLRRDLAALARHTNAVPLKRTALRKPLNELARMLGQAEVVREEERYGHIRIVGGAGEETATIIVSAATCEVRAERLRIAQDVAAAVQAGLRGGVLPGGGAAEIAALPAVLRARTQAHGMEAYGVDCVLEALKRPLAQIVANAGYNPLEKIEQVVAKAREGQAWGVDCETGEVADMWQLGIVDAAPVKIYALRAASEIATELLKIQTVIRRKEAASLENFEE